MQQLYQSARNRLTPATRRVYDEEDAAQSAFHSVCAGLAAGRFPDLHDRNSLWRLLLTTTARKVTRRHQHDHRLRRDVSRNVTDTIFANSPDESTAGGEQGFFSREPTPEFAAEFGEVCERLFRSLDDPLLQQITTLRMEGYSDAEIADRMNCSRRTVQRRLEIIHRHWERLTFPDE